MKVTFSKSGGFAGISVGCEIDSNGFAESTELEKLVKESGILAEMKDIDSTSGGADIFSYRLAVTVDGVQWRRVHFDDVTLPKAYRPLVKFLEAHSKKLIES